MKYLTLLYIGILTGVTAQVSCPCNLLTNACQPSCCCDRDCGTQYKQIAFCNPTSVATQNLRSFPDQFLHVSLDNSPYLGLFFPNPANIASDQFPSLLSSNLLFEFSLPLATPPSAVTDYYKYGDPLLSLRSGATHYSTYPIRGPYGECVASPTPYLQNIHSSCLPSLPYALTQSSILSPPTQVLPTYRYLCTNYTQWIRAYATDTAQRVSLLETPGFSVCSDSEGNLTSCSSDRCQHALLSYYRVITWSHEGIIGIQDEIKLIQLPVQFPIPLILQEYYLRYKSISNQTLSVLALDTSAREQLTLGYLRGSELLFGTEDNITGYFKPSTGALITSTNGLCSAIVPRNVEFLDNVYSGCSLLLSPGFNCTHLNLDLMQLFRAILNATHVARSRRASSTHPTHWVPIVLPPPVTPPDSLCSLPSHLSTRYLYSSVGSVGSYQILELVGAAAELHYSEVPGLQLVATNGMWTVPISTSVEFVRVPVFPSPPPSRSNLRHTPICREPCYASDQLLYPLYQSINFLHIERYPSMLAPIDGFYFSFLLSLVLALLLCSTVNLFLY